MIKFFCENCGESLSIDDMYGSTTTVCPVCREKITIPKVTEIFEFRCSNCNGLISCPTASSGNFIHCENCGEFIEVPSVDDTANVSGNNLTPNQKLNGHHTTSETPGQLFEANNGNEQEITVEDTYRLTHYSRPKEQKRPGILVIIWRAVRDTFLDFFWYGGSDRDHWNDRRF
jgi:DNA-directed RNA polymerase subunit M/transcription elongation factor TFIIS